MREDKGVVVQQHEPLEADAPLPELLVRQPGRQSRTAVAKIEGAQRIIVSTCST